MRLIPAAAILLLLAPLSPAAASDPSCPDGYTGFSVKVGSGCLQYVHCQGGAVDGGSRPCPGSLTYTGGVGEGGICDWPSAANVCKDPGLEDDNEEEGGGTTADEGGAAPRQPSALQQLVESSSSGKFCGSTKADAAANCLPCVQDLCNSPDHACFRGIDACGGGQQEQPEMVLASNLVARPATQQQQQSGGGGAFDLNLAFGELTLGNSNVRPLDGSGSSEKLQQQPAPAPRPAPVISSPTAPTSAAGGAAAASVPSLERAKTRAPTLPPWTNAPYAKYRGPSRPKTVIAYYASWQWYDRDKFADPSNIDFTKYDRINYAFFQSCPLGNLYGTDEWADPQLLWGPKVWSPTAESTERCSWDPPATKGGPVQYNCAHYAGGGILDRAHAVGVEVWPSIGGWTLSDNFPGIAADSARRARFARQCREIIEAYGFDGIDIDWEYPGYADHSGTPNDRANYVKLLEAVRSELDVIGARNNRYYGITAALPCGPDKIKDIDVPRLSVLLDELNLMTYDLHGSWDVLSGHNAPMFDQGWGDTSKGWSVHGCVENYQKLGAPPERINIGLPFFGRSFVRATGMKQWHSGVDDSRWHLDEGSPQYFHIWEELNNATARYGMKTYRHENVKAQSAVFKDGHGMVSYDDPAAICDKVGYANDRGLNGFLIWEISGDMLADGRTPLIDATNRKIMNPGLDCSSQSLRDPVNDPKDLDWWNIAGPEPAEVDWTGYVPPERTGGSANDFNGAVVDAYQAPPPGTTMGDYVSPNNGVWGDSSSSSSTIDGQAYTPSYSTQQQGGEGGGTSSSPGGGDDQLGDCPPGYTGLFPAPGCQKYVTCSDGQSGAEMPCAPGTLFDIDSNACQHTGMVQTCGRRRRRELFLSAASRQNRKEEGMRGQS